MTNIVVSKLRSFLIRALAVVAVVTTYVVGSVGTQVLGVAGISGLALVTTTKPAVARRWRRRVYVRRRWRRWRR